MTCDPPSGDAYFRTQPRLIVEVISPSTAHTDRYEKLMAYRRLPSLQEYVLVMQDEMLIEIHRRRDDDQWEIETYSQHEEVVNFTSIGLSLSVADIYRNVRWDTERP